MIMGERVNHIYLVVSTHLKNICQDGNLPQIGRKIKHIWNHHLGKPYLETTHEINEHLPPNIKAKEWAVDVEDFTDLDNSRQVPK